MAKSELAKKMKKAVDAADKLVFNLTKDAQKLVSAVRELKEANEKEKGK